MKSVRVLTTQPYHRSLPRLDPLRIDQLLLRTPNDFICIPNRTFTDPSSLTNILGRLSLTHQPTHKENPSCGNTNRTSSSQRPCIRHAFRKFNARCLDTR